MPLVAQQDEHYLCFPVSLAEPSQATEAPGDVPGGCSHPRYPQREMVGTAGRQAGLPVPLLSVRRTGMLCSHKNYFCFVVVVFSPNLKAFHASATAGHSSEAGVWQYLRRCLQWLPASKAAASRGQCALRSCELGCRRTVSVETHQSKVSKVLQRDQFPPNPSDCKWKLCASFLPAGICWGA